MNTVTLFKSLQEVFTLPALQVMPVFEKVGVNNIEICGRTLVAELYLECFIENGEACESHDDYLYTATIRLDRFQEYCELTSVIRDFTEWWKYEAEQEFEVRCYAEQKGILQDMKADYANWIAKQPK